MLRLNVLFNIHPIVSGSPRVVPKITNRFQRRVLNLTFSKRVKYSASYFRFEFRGSGSRFNGTRMSRVRSTRRFLVTKCPFLSVVDISRLADFSQEKSATKARLKQEERKLKSPETITVNGSFPFVRKESSSA